MTKKILNLIFIMLLACPLVLAARDKTLEEHVNNEIAFYKNIQTCTPIESSETNTKASRKIFGMEENKCHFMTNNFDCRLPMNIAEKFSQAGARVYQDYSDYGMITSTTADMKYIENEVLYNNRYCIVRH